jgi:hypothetical protein
MPKLFLPGGDSMRRRAAFVGAVSIATATGLLLFSAGAADDPNRLLQRLAQLRDPAQVTQPAAAAIQSPGDAVVTGFSGVRPTPQVAPGVDPLDKTFIDLDGPSVRVINLSAPGAPAQGQVMPAPIPFTVIARQVGQVFAVAQDNATPPNIYVAATSAYGLPIVAARPDSDGTPRRLRRGEAGAQFMPGLFGSAATGGGPGSVWKIDGRTGAVSLFVNIQNSGAGLGDVAFDAARGQFFVSDRSSGLIHRVGLDGVVRDSFDHGTTGRAMVGLLPVPDRPERRLDIQSSAFEPSSPPSWNLPPPARRTFGLSIYKNRLFYALADGPQVWSVALGPDGGFGASASWELSLPPSPRPVEVTSIVFDDDGQIYLAERGTSTGAYDFKVLASPGEARVLRYRLREPGDPPGPGRWAQVPDEYAVGYRPNYRNGNGGLAFGYRYTQNNTFGGCGGTLWTTGEQLRAASDPALVQQLAVSGPLALHGVQGVAVDLLRPRNAPPRASLFIRYDDRIAEVIAREQFGHMGDIVVWQSCGAPPPRLVLTCPIGFYWNGFARLCEPPVTVVTCPAGQRWDGSACAGIICWGGQRFDGRQCVCPPNMVWNDQRCTPGRVCPTGQVLDGERCVPGRICPVGQVMVGDRCAPTPRCPPGQAWDGQTQDCVCPASQNSNGAACQCPPGQYFNGSACQPSNGLNPNPPPGDQPGNCPRGQIQRGDLCLVVDPGPGTPVDQQCPSDRILDPMQKHCVCKSGRESNGVCDQSSSDGGTPPPGFERIPPPRRDLTPPSAFCQGGPFKLVGGTCCLGSGYTCTQKPMAGSCPSGTEYDFGQPFSPTPVCCRSDAAGTCAPPPTESKEQRCARLHAGDVTAIALCLAGSDDRCEPVRESRLERCVRWYVGNNALISLCLAGQGLPGSLTRCYVNSDCAGGACCNPDGVCVAGPQATSVPPPPQTCQEGQTRQGDRCMPACTSGRVWNGEFCVCPNNGRWNGSSCESAGGQPLAQPSCRDGTRWDGKNKKCVPVRTRPKCKGGTRWDGERCRPAAQPNLDQQTAPQSSPGFSIGIGIGGGGRGGRGRPPQGPPPSKGGGIPN